MNIGLSFIKIVFAISGRCSQPWLRPRLQSPNRIEILQEHEWLLRLKFASSIRYHGMKQLHEAPFEAVIERKHKETTSS